MSAEFDAADREVAAAHEVLREALLRALLAQHRRSHVAAHEEGDPEEIEWTESRLAFLEQAVMVDYVVGTMHVALTGKDYSAVLATDGACPRHRSFGLAQLTADFLRDR